MSDFLEMEKVFYGSSTTFSLSSCINAVPVAIPSPAKHPHFAKRVCCTTYAGQPRQQFSLVETQLARRDYFANFGLTGIHGGREILYVFLQQRR